jgi:hypothetical protein
LFYDVYRFVTAYLYTFLCSLHQRILMTTLHHLISQTSNKFRFVVATLLFVVGLGQIAAFALNDASNEYRNSTCLTYKEIVQKASPAGFCIENAEIEEEEREDDDKKHDSTPHHFIKNETVLSYTVAVFFIKTPCLRVAFSQNTAPQPIPLYALHCTWRHHLA